MLKRHFKSNIFVVCDENLQEQKNDIQKWGAFSLSGFPILSDVFLAWKFRRGFLWCPFTLLFEGGSPILSFFTSTLTLTNTNGDGVVNHPTSLSPQKTGQE